MPKAFIAILGTNNYLECRHKFPDGEVSDYPVKYVQEDLIKKYCRDWNSNDEIRIFLTEEAKKKNWLDNGHLDRQNNPIPNVGLFNRIEQMKLSCQVKDITINEGFNEHEIWKIFQTIYDTFRQDEEVIVDITHSFRSLPMLMITILNFAKQLKKIKVTGIYYAAFESLGTLSEIQNTPENDRIAPVLDLTAFSDLQDWTNATYDFIYNANVTRMNSLVKTSISKENSINNKEKFFPSRVIVSLEELINGIALCRGRELLEFKYDELKKDLLSLKGKKLPQAFYYLIDEIHKKIKDFNNDPKILTLIVADWCIQHNLIQQAITLLQEFSVTIILERCGINITDQKKREIVSQALRIISEKIPESEWRKPASENPETVKELLRDSLLKEIASTFNSLTEIRNDVNHGGFLSNARSIQAIKDKLNNILDDYKKILIKNANQSFQSSAE